MRLGWRFGGRIFATGAVLCAVWGLQALAQTPDKSEPEIPRAGINGVGMPKCERCPDPEYSEEARKKKYQGVVVLMVVVTSEGVVRNIEVVRTPGLGLEQKAIEAVRTWKLKPATKDGKPIAVKLPIEIAFRL